MLKTIAVLVITAILAAFYLVSQGDSDKPDQQLVFDKQQYSLAAPSSLWVIVNKQHPLRPFNYVPQKLHKIGNGQMVRQDIAGDLIDMLVAAKKAGLNISLESGYRSFETQQKVYDSMVSGFGAASADKESARPGYSEHQTGLAMDFGNDECKVQDCFAATREGRWLAANSYKYGFILRYPEAKRQITGYKNEAWHYRYVGKGLAAQIHANGNQTLEEYFNQTGGDVYK